jgi:hypothetical protein
MKLELAIDGETFEGELYPNPVADDLAARLPLTLEFADYNGVEKVVRLDRPLSVSGVPSSDEPAPGEIGYYAPGQTLVLYYGTVGRWPGLVRIGSFAWDLEKLRSLPDGFRVRIAAREGGG